MNVPPGSATEPGAGAPDTARRRARRRSPLSMLLVYGGLLAAAFAVGVLLFNAVIMPAFVRRGDEVTVPDLTGKSRAEAEAMLVDTGLVPGETRERHDQRPVDTVIRQQPRPNTAVKSGRTVILTVSLGEPGRQVPDLAGSTTRNAQLALGDVDLVVGDVVRAPSPAVPAEMVVASHPPIGVTLPRGSRVDLLVSTGARGSSGYVMPDLRGRELREVRDRLLDAGFQVDVREQSYSFFRAGRSRITSQEPPPGSRVHSWHTIRLVAD
jgi:beta-lactam-binding protein with PASTA domain